MARALQLAERGLYTTTPNPRVGCVLVRDGVVVGEGWHERAGEAHAEINALRVAGVRAKGATAFVSLEPCSHHGRTPPCVDALIAAGVKHVIAAMQDPNPLVGGQGLAKLRAAGIETQCGLMAAEAAELNQGFVSRMTRGRPFLRMKVAASLDGRTALKNGMSQWITGPEARKDGHHFRARSCAIMAGIGTLKDDDPRLTVRAVPTTRQPTRIVVDSNLQVPLTAKIFDGGPVLIATAVSNSEKTRALQEKGAEVLKVPNAEGKVDLPGLMRELAKREMNEILAESGNRLHGALLKAGLVDELLVYLAPHLLGDFGRGMFALGELTALYQRIGLDIFDVQRVGNDWRFMGRVLPLLVSET
ncbi:MAG: bifunctional diaminohydroxyphosphoribosylaminopyrimidine deaminase/5-amino-6-(5-phosphoribosylamino)uracil reductase RibD [Betaproteobacteria bacterium]|nr:bifunctional diaminohydroxyphosphoribosylaminopyrimidine deaminase/5-amino-6-(5-phosphoribosylamino)uracil reductase RibD [Betaproteobacteria bacterium]